MRSIEAITAEAESITLDEALKETKRETAVRIGTEAKPGGAYNRWADAEKTAFSKHRAYEKQAAAMIAITQVLSVMTIKDWQRLRLRWKNEQERKHAVDNSPTLFSA